MEQKKITLTVVTIACVVVRLDSNPVLHSRAPLTGVDARIGEHHPPAAFVYSATRCHELARTGAASTYAFDSALAAIQIARTMRGNMVGVLRWNRWQHLC